MTAMTPVEKIAELLVEVGYKRIGSPLIIAGLEFELPAVLVGTGVSPDLIIIADTALESEQRVQQKLEGVARALDVMRSRRPLTTILAGPRPLAKTLDAMSRVSRVLPVGDASSEAMLRDWLAVLLPLDLPEPNEDLANSDQTLSQDSNAEDPIVAKLIAAAPDGVGAVQKQLHILIGEPFDDNDVLPEEDL